MVSYYSFDDNWCVDYLKIMSSFNISAEDHILSLPLNFPTNNFDILFFYFTTISHLCTQIIDYNYSRRSIKT